jgi:hypothetical protein
MNNDNDFLVILDDEETMPRQDDADADVLPSSASSHQDSSLASCGIRTRPRVMAWEQGRLVMRTPTSASRPHHRSLRVRN